MTTRERPESPDGGSSSSGGGRGDDEGAKEPPNPPSPSTAVGTITGTTTAIEIPSRHHPEEHPTGRRLAVLSLAALGVVYGDIGTSPLYSMKEAFKHEYGLTPNATNVYGVLSLIVWALILVVTIKYVVFILRADNKGEGGVLALLALVLQRKHRSTDSKVRAGLIAIGLFGGAFLYGDGIITPAISVLGAVEGLEVATPTLARFVVPLAVLIIAVLFYFQDHGTAKVGGLFGWIMLLWFFSIAAIGAIEIAREPQILAALNPWYAMSFFIDHPWASFVVLGAVVLVITGGEALYADMGHFGKRPIRIVWMGLVLPALLINYFGQGGLLLRDPSAVSNPFYFLVPRPVLIPMLIVATLAAVVASQALISGAFSLTQQAVQLGYIPRVTIVHTSAREAGQIYIPEVNKALAVGTLMLVLAFRSSAALGAAYGVAVTGTMAITSILFYVVTREHWGWPAWQSNLFLTVFLAIDLAFFASNILKIWHGGWVPLVIAIVLFTMMATWKRGRLLLNALLQRGSLPMDLFLEDIARKKPPRVQGTAVFMTSAKEGAPVVLLHHLKHNKMLHQRVVLMSIASEEVPEVPADERIEVEDLGQGFYRVEARYGFMESPNVKQILSLCARHGLPAKMQDTSFYLGRERIITTGKSPMARWRKKLFALMSRNAQSATEFFQIPPNRVVELGAQVEF